MTADGQLKVLLVESDGSLRRSISAILEASEFETAGAVDYETALKLLDGGRFDAALVSTRLVQGPPGFVVIRAFRSRQTGPVVALLDEPNFEEAVSALRLGVTDVLVKPPRPSELVAALRNGLGHSALGDLQADPEAVQPEGEDADQAQPESAGADPAAGGESG
ncbi:MAG: response regulator [Myxococcota bacterium]|nr:response regulator [Myxococcota bacterium]